MKNRRDHRRDPDRDPDRQHNRYVAGARRIVSRLCIHRCVQEHDLRADDRGAPSRDAGVFRRAAADRLVYLRYAGAAGVRRASSLSKRLRSAMVALTVLDTLVALAIGSCSNWKFVPGLSQVQGIELATAIFYCKREKPLKCGKLSVFPRHLLKGWRKPSFLHL